jgi:hypothetical protein
VDGEGWQLNPPYVNGPAASSGRPNFSPTGGWQFLQELPGNQGGWQFDQEFSGEYFRADFREP